MSQPNLDSAKRSSVFDHPMGFWFFFWGEFAERCCYYGMRAILLLYMIQILKFSDSSANRVISYFIAACYLLPIVGGFVADKFLGKYRTIVYFAVPYIFGQVLLGIESLHNQTCLYLSLGLLAMGSGVIKPNISTLMGLTYDQRRPGQTKLRSDAFAMFYGSINIGAALSSFCVPWIRNAYGGDSHAYAIAFLFPAALMIMSFIVFALGKPFYATETISRVRLTKEARHERMVVLRRLGGLFLVVMIFWSIFDQSASTWTLFARDHLQLQLNLFNLIKFKLSPDQLQAINPVLIIILLPPVTMLWHLLAKFGWDLRPTDKMIIGFVLTTITMGITAWSAFLGADAVIAGASGSLAAAEKAVASATSMADNPAADKAARKLIDAAASQLSAEKDKSQKHAKAAELAMEASRKDAKDAGLEAVAVIAARHATTASIHAAKIASDMANAKSETTNLKESKEAKETVTAAEAAAEAVSEAVKLATSAAREEDPADSKKSKVDLTICAVAANRATAAAAAATRSAEAAGAGNVRAAQVNAAVAGVNAADAAVAAAQVAATLKDVEPPSSIKETEIATAEARISLLWQVIPYILITMAEVCISVVGLELAFAAAPASMKSFVTACWLLTVFFGDILNAWITPLYNETFWGISLTPDWYFLLFALLMIPVTLAFVIMARRFNRTAE